MNVKHIGLFILLLTTTSDAMTSQPRGLIAQKPKPAASQAGPTTRRATTASLPDQYVNKYILNPTTTPKTLPELARDKIQMVSRKIGDALTGINWAERIRPYNSLENYALNNPHERVNLPQISKRKLNIKSKDGDNVSSTPQTTRPLISMHSEKKLTQAEAKFKRLLTGSTQSEAAKAYNDFHKAQKAIAKRENTHMFDEKNNIEIKIAVETSLLEQARKTRTNAQSEYDQKNFLSNTSQAEKTRLQSALNNARRDVSVAENRLNLTLNEAKIYL